MNKAHNQKARTSAIERAVKVLEMAPEKRFHSILGDPDPAGLVKALPPQEFWITIKRTGVNDSLELLELTSDEQLIFLQDIECWIGDKLDPKRTLGWFEQLIGCGPEKVVQWLRAVDADTFIVALQQFMRVTKPDEGADPHQFADTLPPYTLDNVYYLHFFDEKHRDIVGQILSQLAQLRFDLYARMMEGMVWEVGPEMELQARRWRDGRLGDLGVPTLDEAMVIYQYLDEVRFNSLPAKSSPVAPEEGHAPPRFPMMAHGQRLLLMEALSIIPPGKSFDGIVMELAHLANRVVVADTLDMSDANHVTKAVSKVGAVLSMGLETLAGKNVAAAADLLSHKWLLHIFQVGYGLTLKLARRAHRLYQTGWLKQAAEARRLLGNPLENILAGLRRPRPLWYVGGPEPYRLFESLDELHAAKDALDRIEYLGELFFKRLKIIRPDPASWSWKRIYPVEINFETALRTALAHAAAGKGFEFLPLTKADLIKFIETAFEPLSDNKMDGDRNKKRIKREVHGNLADYLTSRDTAKNAIELRIRDDIVSSALKFLEDELGRLDPKTLEPKYIQGLVIRK